MKKAFELSDNEKLTLEMLELEWDRTASKLHTEQFGKDYHDFGSVIGAGVKVYRRIRNTRYVVAFWRGSGKTGESEAYSLIESRLKNIGFESVYEYGVLD